MASPIPMPTSTYMLGQPAAQGQPMPLDPNGGRQYQDGTLPAQQVPQTGLIGSEQALMQGQYGNEQALQQGLGLSTSTINQGVNNGANTLYGGVNQAGQILNQGLNKSEGYILGGSSGALESINQSYNNANKSFDGLGSGYTPAQIESINNGYTANTAVGANITDPLNQGAANFQGFLSGGQNAAKLQADLTGANGQAAQQAAYAQYQSSPAMQYQMDQMQKATERSAAARGGALGGNVLLELQRNASGIASQDYQNQFNNMNTVANQGVNAANQIAGLKSTQAGIAGNLQQAGISADAQASIANQQAGMNAQIANQDAKNNQMALQQKQNYDVKSKLADLASTYGVNVGNLLTGTGNALGKNTLDFSQAQAKNVLGASGDVSQAQFGASNAIAGNQIGTYQALGQSQYNTGVSLANGRTNAGTAIAKNATDAAAGIGKLLESQGVNVSNEMANDIASTTKMISDYGLQDKISNENLAAMIANITGGQATNTQNAYGNIGAAQAAGTMGVSNAVQGGVTQGLMLGAIGKPNYNSSQYDQAFSQMPFSKG